VNPSSGAGGCYQLIPSTADSVARSMGRPDLVGRNASTWPVADQEAAAAYLYNGGAGCSHWSC